MNEPKPIAALSASLLARKGDARPAMRRAFIPQNAQGHGSQEDLGWNDMGEPAETPPAPVLSLTPLPRSPAPAAEATPAGQESAPRGETPDVIEQRKALTARFAALDDAATRSAQNEAAIKNSLSPSLGRKPKAAFTLRLDAARHLRLRLACAVMNKSAQRIVSDALDAFLDSQPDLEKLACQVPVGGAANSE